MHDRTRQTLKCLVHLAPETGVTLHKGTATRSKLRTALLAAAPRTLDELLPERRFRVIEIHQRMTIRPSYRYGRSPDRSFGVNGSKQRHAAIANGKLPPSV
jgi:hypothetical protein